MNGELMSALKPNLTEETLELLDEVYDAELALEFIEEYGEEKFQEYYEDYQKAIEDFNLDIVNAFIEVFYLESIGNIEESYQGQMTGAEFAEQIASDCGYVRGDLPSWIEIDWKESWDNLSYDYCEQDGYIFSQNF